MDPKLDPKMRTSASQFWSKNGPENWTLKLDPKTGSQNWTPKLDPKTGPQKLDPKMVPKSAHKKKPKD